MTLEREVRGHGYRVCVCARSADLSRRPRGIRIDADVTVMSEEEAMGWGDFGCRGESEGRTVEERAIWGGCVDNIMLEG